MTEEVRGKTSGFHTGERGPDEEFDVLVAATVSAGKSTLLNALLGQELLYSSNEPATAQHTRVRHVSGASGVAGAAYGSRGRVLDMSSNASSAELQAWSATPGIRRIDLVGDFPALSGGRVPVTLHDAPGGNNSGNPGLEAIALACMKDVPWGVLLYVLNAAHPGTVDDHRLLESVSRAAKRHAGGQVVFVLNKIDLLDEERGESVGRAVDAARRWARTHGFVEPYVVPVMAGIGLSARLTISGRPTSSRQQLHLRRAINQLRFQRDHLVEAAIIPDIVRAHLADRCAALRAHASLADALPSDDREKAALHHLSIASGLGTLEFLIQHHIEQARVA